MRRAYSFVPIALPICLALTASGQQSQPQQTSQDSGGYVLNMNSQIVLLDVVVNDKMGNNIHGLTKDDFTVYEDKSPQTIRSFEEVVPTPIDKVVPIHSTAELDKLEPNAPVSVIVLDELNTKFVDLAFARYSLKKYLAAEGDTLAQPTLLLAVDYKNVKVLRDYTTSRQEILNALEHHLAGYTTAMQNPVFYGEQIDAAVGSLIGVAQATAGHPGHKNMIWLGRGFPIVDPDYTTPETIQQFRDLIATATNLLRASRVTLYMIDPAAISADPPQKDGSRLNANDPFASEFDFRTIAFVTGGQTFSDHNDVDRTIGESARDGRSFYTLSYRPPGTSEGAKSFRNIHIVVKNPELHVSTRQGYFEGDVPVAPVREADGKYSKSMLVDLGVASNSLLVYDGVPLTVVRDPAAVDRFLLEMKAADLPLTMDGQEKFGTELTVLAESYDKHGKRLNRSAQMVRMHTLADTPGDPLSSRVVKLPVTIATAAPAARVRFVVRADANGKLGADNFFLVDRNTITDPATGLRPDHIYH